MASRSLLLLTLACLYLAASSQMREDKPLKDTVLEEIRDSLVELKNMTELRIIVMGLMTQNQQLTQKLETVEKDLKTIKETPKVAFAASLGGNGLQTTIGKKNLAYKDVLTNVGGAYNPETGVFKAPVRGIYYIRFTANAPSDYTMSSVLYKNDDKIMLIAHESPSGEGSDTASNGAPFLLEEGDELRMKLWERTQIWDNSNHHSTFSGFLLFPL